METRAKDIKLTPLGIKDKNQKLPLYRVDKEIVYETKYGKIVIPIGYITDRAQIPSYGRWLFRVDDPSHLRAAILHDFLFSFQGGKKISNWKLTHISFSQANELLYEYAKIDGTPKWKSCIMWVAVSLGGQSIWDKHNQANIVQIDGKIDLDPNIY